MENLYDEPSRQRQRSEEKARMKVRGARAGLLDVLPEKTVPEQEPASASRETAPSEDPAAMDRTAACVGDDPTKQALAGADTVRAREIQGWRGEAGDEMRETLGHCVKRWETIIERLDNDASVETKEIEGILDAMDKILAAVPECRWRGLRQSVSLLLGEVQMPALFGMDADEEVKVVKEACLEKRGRRLKAAYRRDARPNAESPEGIARKIAENELRKALAQGGSAPQAG